MLSSNDLFILELIDQATPIKDIVNQHGIHRSSLQRKLKHYKQHKLIIKKNRTPITYDTTFRGGMLVLFLRQYKELL